MDHLDPFRFAVLMDTRCLDDGFHLFDLCIDAHHHFPHRGFGNPDILAEGDEIMASEIRLLFVHGEPQILMVGREDDFGWQ